MRLSLLNESTHIYIYIFILYLNGIRLYEKRGKVIYIYIYRKKGKKTMKHNMAKLKDTTHTHIIIRHLVSE